MNSSSVIYSSPVSSSFFAFRKKVACALVDRDGSMIVPTSDSLICSFTVAMMSCGFPSVMLSCRQIQHKVSVFCGWETGVQFSGVRNRITRCSYLHCSLASKSDVTEIRVHLLQFEDPPPASSQSQWFLKYWKHPRGRRSLGFLVLTKGNFLPKARRLHARYQDDPG